MTPRVIKRRIFVTTPFIAWKARMCPEGAIVKRFAILHRSLATVYPASPNLATNNDWKNRAQADPRCCCPNLCLCRFEEVATKRSLGLNFKRGIHHVQPHDEIPVSRIQSPQCLHIPPSFWLWSATLSLPVAKYSRGMLVLYRKSNRQC